MQAGSPVTIGETGSARCHQGQALWLSLGYANAWHDARSLTGSSLFDSVVDETLWSHALREAGGCP